MGSRILITILANLLKIVVFSYHIRNIIHLHRLSKQRIRINDQEMPISVNQCDYTV